jgi:hypothetical protein
MARLGNDFFLNNEVLIVGYPLAADPSMKMIMKAFLDNGIKVIAMNADATGDTDVKTYKSLAELPTVPKTAYIYLDRKDIGPYVKPLAASGIKRVLFHSKKDVDAEHLEACGKAGMETAVACPMMLLGKGYHKFHAFLAGIR